MTLMEMMYQTIEVNEFIQLNAVEESDVPNLVKYLNDPILFANTLTIPSPYLQKDAEQYIQINRDFESQHKIQCNWSIHKLGVGLIGGIGLMFNYGVDSHKSEIGYWLAREFRGAGIMSDVIQVFVQHMFALYGLVRLEAKVFTHNPASAKVLEKNGFVREGLHRKETVKQGNYLDVWMYALVI